MNEQLKKLKEQATSYTWNGNSVTEELDEEKFAELIVRECINKIESQRSSGENTDQWTITRDLCYHSMMADLKEHFGVE
jgi:hypothetical protein